MLVEDDPDTAEMVRLLIQTQEQCEVVVAYNGREALKSFETQIPDLVLLDLGLPDESGYKVACKMRNRSHGNHCMIVALTGYEGVEDEKKAEQDVFDYYLIKPIDKNILNQFFKKGAIR